MTTTRQISVRRLTVADLTACSDLAESRGWGREEHKWRLLLTAGQGLGIDAHERNGALLGTCVLTSYEALTATAEEPAPGPGTACVGMMLVAEDHGRRGLGRRLLEQALAAAGDVPVFLYATETGRPLYERLGFRPQGTVTSLTGRFRPPPDEARPREEARTEACTYEEPLPDAPCVRTARAADLAAVRALDAPVFGADRLRLLLRLRQFADRFVVAEDARGTLCGYAAAWPNDGTRVIGPVVAQDTATARALVRDLARHAPGDVRLDVDARHTELTDWARRHGLDGGFLCTLMSRSPASSGLPGDAARRFAPYSVALG
ncbi:acetyltransferase (GNAT) family protein [Streptomyces sp. Amel2xB2]|uniref:GNAT family N-acetyltransferase n=1 Tax=Streptomyces sp. Amel2xB2 TaxID=1305829 RepID=UPI000DBFEEB2|nr:GNAT family N-acetyltransferase [Streptomyces sp. Amel2xB2]RAJ66485.1 acetyltransferase (GNAT) family protein [Streptomyces sp. Amel2xB2]